ncbi:hypothetical protein CNR22_21260 [Sphingobacteriaceae bacterium]|nr:hypothetical protein CNR22_21260 [Sphingobacteriaceae bacterium]
MHEELNRKQELLNSLSNSLKTELKNPHLSFIRKTYLKEKIELIKGISNSKTPRNKSDFKI